MPNDKEPSRLTLSASVAIEAAKGEDKLPTFDMVGYTGDILKVAGFFNPVIVDLSGLKTPGQSIPVLRNHDQDRIIGQTDSIAIGEEVRLGGVITGDDDDTKAVITHSRNGFKWQASIGADVLRREFLEAGKTATVNGREVAGPLVIARESMLFEISFVAIGADRKTSASVAASNPSGSRQGEPSMFEQWLQAKGFDPSALGDDAKTFLKAQYDAEQATRTAPAPAPAPAAPPPATRATTLAEIVEAQRKEDDRVAEITRIATDAMTERPMMREEINAMAEAAIEAKGTTVLEFELQTMRRLRANIAPAASMSRRADQRVNGAVVEAALCRAGGLGNVEARFDEKTLEATDRAFPHGLGLVEVLQLAASENGTKRVSAHDIGGLLRAAFQPEIRAQGFSTFSLPGTLANTANKFLVDGFTAVDSTWRSISSKRSVRDFKQISSYALTGGFLYEEVGAQGEIKHATVGETSYTNQIKQYGRMFAISRVDLINDDLGALTQVPSRLGRGAALALNNTFWTVFLNNSSFFSSGHTNVATGAGSALSLASLDVANALFVNQTDPDGYPVAITPRILLVPPALRVAAQTFMSSTMVQNNTTANTVTMASNPFAGAFRVESSPYMSNSAFTGYSAAAWYLLADPSDLPVIEVAFLNGRDTPVVESADVDFNTLGVQFRGYMDWGVALFEYRGGVRSAGS